MARPQNLSEMQHIFELLKDFKSAMLVTVGNTHQLHGRPMALAKVEENLMVWFITAVETAKTYEINQDNRVLVTCQSDDQSFLSMAGTAEVSFDRRKIAEIWHDGFKAWFPKGKDDPDIALIRIKPEVAEYWDNEGVNKTRYLVQVGRGLATGTQPRVSEPAQHGKINP